MKTGNDVPLLRGSITIRSPRSVLLLNPYQLFLAVGVFVVALVFTVWPEALDHAPIGFEQRGVIHHVWHYALLWGAAMTLWGMFAPGEWRTRIELAGLCLVVGMVGMNLTAVISDAAAGEGLQIAGLDLAFRITAAAGMAARIFIIVREPTVDLHTTEAASDPATETNGG